MATRKIVQIDETKCDGCGLCVPSCAEGAIQVIDGKARLVSDVYCDGLGACLGQCPQDAIHIIEREANEFDEAAAHRHVSRLRGDRPATLPTIPVAAPPQAPARHGGGCPGSMLRQFTQAAPRGLASFGPEQAGDDEGEPTALGQWPVQLHLVPPNAPFLRDGDLLLVADCVPFAMPDFHKRLLRGRPIVIGCPKLDDNRAYLDKLASILAHGGIRSLTVVHMEVPCCTGLVRLAESALELTGSAVPLEEVTISIRGKVLTPLKTAAAGVGA
jgi:Pyruvate/2-oxoacid:ferredoxin oxidoreductase delta subunit